MMTNSIDEQYNEDHLDKVYAELYEAQVILECAYEKVTPTECECEQDHMTLQAECLKFKSILDKHKTFFDGKSGLYPHEILHLQ